MKEPDAASYGQAIAGVYDRWYEHLDTEGATEFLYALARNGRALELGVGTGRVALPLAKRGVQVTGIDLSRPMLDVLRGSPGGEAVDVIVGDFANPEVAGTFGLIYAVFSTFFFLLSRDAQVTCFQNVARLLEPDGAFVIEALVPNLSYFDGNQRMVAEHIGEADVRFGLAIWDPLTQRISKRMVTVDPTGTALYPVEVRYVWPSELDLMARIAGLRLRERFGGWRGVALTAASATHVSVYSHPA